MYSKFEQAYKIKFSAKTANHSKPLTVSLGIHPRHHIPGINVGSQCTSNLAINSKINRNMKILSAEWIIVEKIWKVYINILQ